MKINISYYDFYEKLENEFSDILCGLTNTKQKELEIMDSTAISLCKDNKIPICVFNLFQKNNIKKIILGKKVGTIVS